MAETMALVVNGAAHRVRADGDRSLLSTLRDELSLTGSKYGCGEGQCGSCTVLIDGVAVRACITPVGSALGREVTTIEGLEKQGQLHPVQEAFLEVEAMQCGYCTPGMVMSAVALLQKTPAPTRAEIARFMQGNICRCGVYARIVTAIEQAAKKKEVRGHG